MFPYCHFRHDNLRIKMTFHSKIGAGGLTIYEPLMNPDLGIHVTRGISLLTSCGNSEPSPPWADAVHGIQ